MTWRRSTIPRLPRPERRFGHYPPAHNATCTFPAAPWTAHIVHFTVQTVPSPHPSAQTIHPRSSALPPQTA